MGPFFTHKMGISVVVTTYNRPFFLLNLVRQLLTQNVERPVEILVVNDGGDPGVPEVLRSALGKSRFPVRLFDSGYQGYGLTLCRNIGIRHANYDQLVFLDDDLSIGASLLSCYSEAPEGLRMGTVLQLTTVKNTTRLVADARGALLTGETRAIDDYRSYMGFLWGANFSIPTRYAMAVGGFDESFLDEGQEDMDFGARIIQFLDGFFVVPSASAVHLGVPQSLDAHNVNAGRTGRMVERFCTRRSLIVNGGLSYWMQEKWSQYQR
ncbi:MAG: glycosyltransferase [Acidiferrobacteraceae bacterium]|jgi:glycosyltransferase involved in cell wall biosynthesis|nr:glycosyltransferase [Bacteroidetes Order II. bacterium]MBT6733488.1 glycosyltransferase [Acidiferrobacteraceae bacterium]